MQEWERKECREETEMKSPARGLQEEEQEGLGAK